MEIKQWITAHPNGKDSKGVHIPVMENQSKSEAINSFIDKNKKEFRQNVSYTEILNRGKDNKKLQLEKAYENPTDNIPAHAKLKAEKFIKEKGWDKGYMRDSMYGRLLSDVNYYFGYGGRSESVLWAKDLQEQLALLEAINPKSYAKDIKKYKSLIGKREADLILKQ